MCLYMYILEARYMKFMHLVGVSFSLVYTLSNLGCLSQSRAAGSQQLTCLPACLINP